MFDYTAADLSSGRISAVTDVGHLAFASHAFEAVVCNHVLEHVPEDRQALAEIRRVMKPGGWASLQVPMLGEITVEDLRVTDCQDRARLYGQVDHVRQYGSDFRRRLETAGFYVISLSKDELLSPLQRQRVSVDCEVGIWICLKID